MDAQDCIALSSRTKFTAYIDLLRNNTGGDFSLVRGCRKEVCGALWGSGNPDISGIGMTIGYLLESVLCAILVGGSLLLEGRSKGRPDVRRLLLSNATRTFYDNAIFFAFAIQTASIVTLARVDFGINADGMGGFTMEVAWLVSSLTLLPLLPTTLRPKMFVKGRRTDIVGSRPSSHNARSVDARDKVSTSGRDDFPEAVAEARQGQRFLFFVICWAMGFCPFFSRMGATFGRPGERTELSCRLTSYRRKSNWRCVKLGDIDD
jgi:hypothetical protein